MPPRLAGLAVDASLLYAAHARAAVDRISLAVEYPAVNHGGEFFVRELRDEILDRRLPGEHIAHLYEGGRLRELLARGRGGFAAEAVSHFLHDDGLVEIHFRHMDATVGRASVADKYRAAIYLPLRLVVIVQGRAGRDHWRLCEGAEPRCIERTPVKPAHDDIRPRHLARVSDRHGNLDVFQAPFDLCGRQLERRVGKAVAERIPHHLHVVNLGAGVSLQVEASAFCIEVSVADIRSLGILDFRGLPAAGRRVVAVALRPRVDGPAGRIHLSRQNARYRIARRLAEERDEHKRLDRVLVHERRIEHARRVQEDNDAVERGAGVGEKPLLLGVQTPSAGRLRDVRRLARAASDHDNALLGALALGELRERVMGAFRLVEAPRPLVPVAV